MSFRDVGEKIIEGTAAGLYEAGTIVMAESQHLVPVEYGTLKRSAIVEEPVVTADHATVTLGYGYGSEYTDRAEREDPDGPGYGLFVHEIARYKHAPPTVFKFLERPVREFSGELGPTIEAAVKQRTGRL